MKENIVLVGMPGAGKSTIGILLAKALNYGFIDTDLLIQISQRKKLYEIISEVGILEFIKIENETLSRIKERNKIIATGGSAIFGKEAMQNLKKQGTVVYIKLSYEEINRRVTNIKTRGIVMKEGKTLEDVYVERTPLYEQYADIVVDCEGLNIEETVEKVIDRLDKLDK